MLTSLPLLLPPFLPLSLPPLQIRLHDVGGVWIFLAACIGLGALWNAAIWALGGSSGTAGGHPSTYSMSSELLAGEESSQSFGQPVTLEVSVRLAQARLIKVRASTLGRGLPD